MNQFLEEQYKNLGISREVYEFGEKIEESLKELFAETGRNIGQNTTLIIPAHDIPAFKPSKEFSNKIKKQE